MTVAASTGALIYPVSAAQQRVWMADQLQAPGSAYLLVDAFQLAGPLDFAAMDKALGELARRHEALRTTFEILAGHLVQVVRRSPAVHVEHWPDSRAELDAVVASLVAEGIDVQRGPLLRMVAVERDSDHPSLVVVAHHLITDGWSTEIFYRELGELYWAAHADTPITLPTPSIEYHDYAVWDRANFAEATADLVSVELAGAPTETVWRGRPDVGGVTGSTGGRVRVRVDDDSVKRARQVARAEGCTLFAYVLAQYARALAPAVASRELVVGIPVAGRAHPDLDGLIGLFVNMVPVRLPLSSAGAFGGLLREVRIASTRALANQSVPFELVARAIQAGQGSGRHALFTVVLAYNNTPAPDWTLGGLATRQLEVNPGASPYDATLQLEPVGSGLGGYLEFDRLQVGEQDASAIVERFERGMSGST